MSLIFVDVEAEGAAPTVGVMTEFGAVEYKTRKTFHGVLWETTPNPQNPALPIRTGKQYNAVTVFTEFEQWLLSFKGQPIFISDNVAYDFMWICCGFWATLGRCPFGHSGRRISDFYAGLTGDFYNTQSWKRLRITPHTHNPVCDATGNAEAFERMMAGER